MLLLLMLFYSIISNSTIYYIFPPGPLILYQEITGLKITIQVLVDSKTLFNIMAELAGTLEKRLQIDVFSN